MIVEDHPERQKSCGFVLYREQEGTPHFLILRSKSHGKWGLPKGHVEEGEEELETAVRELHEETGIREVEIDSDFVERIRYTFRGGTVDKEVVYFLAGVTPETEVRLSPEHLEYRWMEVEEGVSLLSFENVRRVVRYAAAHLASRDSCVGDADAV